ncbi:MAG TPA: hypothetical protein VK518_14625 [Puia sp.]|nr:hypothetical protein [Puia sp.]
MVQLHKQQIRLWIKKKSLPWIPLSEPYQKGWKRSFVLREDVQRSNNAAFYQSLLEKINTIQYSKDKTFKIKRRRRGKKVSEVKKQFVHEFWEWEWNSSKLKLTEDEKRLFYRKETPSPKHRYTIVKYVYTEPWRFILRISPHIITHAKMVDEDLEQEIQLLGNYVQNNYLRHKIYKIHKGRKQNQRRFYNVKPKYDPIKNMSIHTILEECKKENL